MVNGLTYCILQRIRLTKLSVKTSKKKIQLNWKKVKGASNYTVYISDKQNSGYKKVGTYNSKKTSATIRKFGKRH